MLIGVDDNGTVVGLENDYKSANKKKPNRDGYQLFLENSMTSKLGVDASSFYAIIFHQIEGKEVCQITVNPASKAIFFKDELYLRNGNQTCRLKGREAIEYHKDRWK